MGFFVALSFCSIVDSEKDLLAVNRRIIHLHNLRKNRAESEILGLFEV